ncbi:hypothetical protein INS49_001336 [Diaporthe citri]|uniref:uncharacterized protein n=1 Tax=Diaporthe citri TaxID=83186 RepID=UPI001C7FF833|nr:uncharacterized protein INS49_001336 [Diaporthe citri]KAG6367152.1 hypothetical protein INS49_001336 [Diaporthe citri]
MATNHQEEDHKKATGLQKALETQLLGLEKLGALPTTAADEVRNIIAEGIADKFGETYRTFPCAREGTEIRRDAVPKQCSLRKSVEGFVAEARSPGKVSKVKVQGGQKKVITKTTTAKERATFKALAQVNAAQRNLGSTIGHAARDEKTTPRKTASPEKQQPKTSPNPSDPAKDGTSKDWQQTRLESGEKAWDVLLAQKAAGIKAAARAGNQQNPITQGAGNPMLPVAQKAGVTSRKDGRAATAATPKNGTGVPKLATTHQPSAAAAGTSCEAPNGRTTTEELAKPKSSSSGKASNGSSENLIDFGF